MQFRANGLPDWASLDTGDGDKTLMRQKHADANSKLNPTNAIFATVNQMFSGSSQLPTAAEHCFVIWTVHSDLITTCSAVVGSWEELPSSLWVWEVKGVLLLLRGIYGALRRTAFPAGAQRCTVLRTYKPIFYISLWCKDWRSRQ